MDNRHSFDARQDTVTQASEFFVEFRAGDGTPAVRARFERWLRSSPENIRAYLEIAAGWSELPTADPEGRIDIQALLAAAHDANDENVVHLQRSKAHSLRRAKLPRMRRWTVAGSAALLLVALTITGIRAITQRGHTYDTGIGEQRTLILADGSTVMLNALTTIRVNMTRQAREVTLIRGQAYFHDKDQPDRPFIVHAGESLVRAIGTEFDVNKEHDRIVVTVLAGQVAVVKAFAQVDSVAHRELLRELANPAGKLRAVLVSAGEQVTVLAQSIPSPNQADVTAVTAWMQQRLIFDGTPLEQVAEQFDLYSRRRLVIADPSLRSIGVSGVYSVSDQATLIAFLRSQPTMRVVETDDEYIVTKR